MAVAVRRVVSVCWEAERGANGSGRRPSARSTRLPPAQAHDRRAAHAGRHARLYPAHLDAQDPGGAAGVGLCGATRSISPPESLGLFSRVACDPPHPAPRAAALSPLPPQCKMLFDANVDANKLVQNLEVSRHAGESSAHGQASAAAPPIAPAPLPSACHSPSRRKASELLSESRMTPKMFAHQIKSMCARSPQTIVLPEVGAARAPEARRPRTDDLATWPAQERTLTPRPRRVCPSPPCLLSRPPTRACC
jgi:hypothetical protein